ncbi:MAG: hypothetical protein WCC70_08600 [Candidatus Aquilonibacter sp.]
MHRWETLIALVAVILASASALPIPGRLWLAGVAIVLLALVGAAQLHRSLTGSRETRTGQSPEEIARRIRDQRNRR